MADNGMKYCVHCGAQIYSEAVYCVHCGRSVVPMAPVAPVQAPRDDTLATVVKVFLILGCISMGWCIIPLAWCVPITVSIFGKLGRGEPIGTGLKVCTLLFVSLVGGICLLCMDDGR